MFFTVQNKHYLTPEQLRTDTLMTAYFIIEGYPLKASEQRLDNFIQKQYKTSLKNMCITLLLNLTFYRNKEGNLILMFKDKKYDTIASLITYGNGVIQGSNILRAALQT